MANKVPSTLEFGKLHIWYGLSRGKMHHLHLALLRVEGRNTEGDAIIKMDRLACAHHQQHRTIKNNGVHYTCRQCQLKQPISKKKQTL